MIFPVGRGGGGGKRGRGLGGVFILHTVLCTLRSYSNQLFKNRAMSLLFSRNYSFDFIDCNKIEIIRVSFCPVSPELQSTGFLFSWKVCGGEVRILQVFGLDSYPENRKYRTFNVAAKEASEFRTKFSVPRSISSFVQAFSNHTVFTGKSLKYLRHPFLPLVLVL